MRIWINAPEVKQLKNEYIGFISIFIAKLLNSTSTAFDLQTTKLTKSYYPLHILTAR